MPNEAYSKGDAHHSQAALLLERVILNTDEKYSSSLEKIRTALANGTLDSRELDDEIVRLLVLFATPKWVRRTVVDNESWLAMSAENARLLASNAESRVRLQRIWKKLLEIE